MKRGKSKANYDFRDLAMVVEASRFACSENRHTANHHADIAGCGFAIASPVDKTTRLRAEDAWHKRCFRLDWGVPKI